jgi:hypothetical protein
MLRPYGECQQITFDEMDAVGYCVALGIAQGYC